MEAFLRSGLYRPVNKAPLGISNGRKCPLPAGFPDPRSSATGGCATVAERGDAALLFLPPAVPLSPRLTARGGGILFLSESGSRSCPGSRPPSLIRRLPRRRRRRCRHRRAAATVARRSPREAKRITRRDRSPFRAEVLLPISARITLLIHFFN